MTKTVPLGSLPRGRVFRREDGTRWKVIRNLGVAGVSVQSLAEHEVTVAGKTFVKKSKATEVWTASAPVEVEVRDRAP